ncbi:hypothetical protein GJ698_13310 [Pseudoduganella sp. FT26W]|uniref:Uncharacterized protein n=1 Tax=Duganella aquatilis TaxID=2666082 RepID=A0A844DBF1_9BURK|nr:hypothetical protein [Duganella aquatilis]MRW85060.1 hypothetical protein [Duganella aquatilis]
MEPRSLGTQVTQFEERSRIEFTEIGWNLLSNKTTEFYASLYAETRRECVMRSEGLATNLYSEVDVERAALRLDFQRFVSRRRTQSFFRLGTMTGSLLSGIFGNWAFSDINNGHPSMLPWCLLIFSVVLTTALYHLQVLREIEP